MIKTVDDVIEMNRRLTAIATQVIDDVNEAGDSGDLYLLYDRMVANAQDFETALQIQQQVAQSPWQGGNMSEFLMEVGSWFIAIGLTSVMFILLMYCLAVLVDVITREKG